MLGEILLAAYFLAATIFAIVENYWVGVPFLLVFFNGFAYTAILSASGPASQIRFEPPSARGRLPALRRAAPSGA